MLHVPLNLQFSYKVIPNLLLLFECFICGFPNIPKNIFIFYGSSYPMQVSTLVSFFLARSQDMWWKVKSKWCVGVMVAGNLILASSHQLGFALWCSTEQRYCDVIPIRPYITWQNKKDLYRKRVENNLKKWNCIIYNT